MIIYLTLLSTKRTMVGIGLAGLMLVASCGSNSSDVRVQPVTSAATIATPASEPRDQGAPTTIQPNSEPVELPFAPANRVGGGLLVAKYLAGGLANIEDCLPELVRDWELEPVIGQRCATGDFDGDSLDELIFVVSISGHPVGPGDVWFFDDEANGYQLLTSARALANEILSGINIEATIDLTGDGAAEAVISTQICDGERCTVSFVIASAHRGFDIEDMSPDNFVVLATEGLTFEDGNNDQLIDLLVQQKVDPENPTEGPQRGTTHIISWSGLRFRANEIPDPAEFLFHTIVDADEAYRTGDFELAIELYLQAADDVSLRDWKAELGGRPSRTELQPYALFRAALGSHRQGHPDTALLLLHRASTEHQDSLHGLAAEIYLQAIENGKSLSDACTETESYLHRLESVHLDIWNYGLANPSHDISSLCR